MPGSIDFITLLAKVSYDPFFVIDGQHRITHYNHPFELTFDLSAAKRRKIIGTTIEALLQLDGTGKACITDCIKGDTNVRVQSVRATTHDGTHLVLDMSALPLRDEQNKVTGIFVMFRDVTDEHRLRERYDQTKKEALSERESLLRILADRDAELKRLKQRFGGS